ncbi:hypothetical protein BY996DRAFT_6568880 [Phakopsora pachyrhizi]|nr:hypothetical protein BY996DRAFT_6568880 [Phakopsora pachyrhizi]
MTNLKVKETSNFNQASSTTLEEDPYIKRGNKSIHTETGKHLNNALQSPTQSPRMTRLQGCEVVVVVDDDVVVVAFENQSDVNSPTETINTSSASKPYHSVHQQNSGCWKLEQPGWLWVNHLSTLCSVSSSSAWNQPWLPSEKSIRSEVLVMIPGIVDGQISQVQSDCNSLEIPSLSWIDLMINDANQSIHRLKLLGYISALTGQRIPRSGTDGRIDPKLTRLVGGTETLSPVVASELL